VVALEYLLQWSGYAVLVARDGDEALGQIEAKTGRKIEGLLAS
jgi:hypothetical protein